MIGEEQATIVQVQNLKKFIRRGPQLHEDVQKPDEENMGSEKSKEVKHDIDDMHQDMGQTKNVPNNSIKE